MVGNPTTKHGVSLLPKVGNVAVPGLGTGHSSPAMLGLEPRAEGRFGFSSSSRCSLWPLSWPWASAEGGSAGTAAAWHGCASAAASASGGSMALDRQRGSGASSARQSTGILMEGAKGG